MEGWEDNLVWTQDNKMKIVKIYYRQQVNQVFYLCYPYNPTPLNKKTQKNQKQFGKHVQINCMLGS